MDLLFYPVVVVALLLPAVWLWRRGEPPLESVALGAAFGVLLWGALAFLRFLLVFPSGLARDVGLVALAFSAGAIVFVCRLTRQPAPRSRLDVPASTWAAIVGGALFLLGLEAALPHYGVIQWSFDWWMHFDLARFYLHPVDAFRVYPGGDVISARTPLYNLLGSLSLATLGNRFAIMQVFTAAVGWLWLLPAALLARRWFGTKNSVLALLALSPVLTFSNAYAWPKGLVLFLLLLSLERVLTLRALKNDGVNRIAVQVGLAIGGAIMAHAGFAGYVLPLIALLAWDGRVRRDGRPFACMMAAIGAVLLPWYCWSVAEYGWQRGLLGYYHAQAGTTDIFAFGVQRLMILVTGVFPVTPQQLGLTQDYFLIYLGSAAGLGGVVFLIWTAAQAIRRRDPLAPGWTTVLWFVACGAVIAALLCRQYAVASAGALFMPALVVLTQLTIGSRRPPTVVVVLGLVEVIVCESLLLVWMWSPAAASQPNAQLAAAEHVQFLSRSALPGGIGLMLVGAVACVSALAIPFRVGKWDRSIPNRKAA